MRGNLKSNEPFTVETYGSISYHSIFSEYDGQWSGHGGWGQ